MTLNDDALLLIGFVLGGSIISLSVMLYRLLNIAVDEKEVVLVSRFGRLQRSIDVPGWHFMWDRSLPWVQVRRVSTRLECRTISGVVVNDARGTTVTVDVFLEFRILDPYKASFAVVDWERAITSLVSHSVTSALGNRQFEDILSDRSSLADSVRREVTDETNRWGIGLERLMIRSVTVLPEVSHEMMRSVAARIERWKADIEEDGRQRVAFLEAKTGREVAQLVAEARSQYPAAMGRAFDRLKASPAVCKAYNELYELSLMHPQRTIAFVGFAEGEIRPVDAAMIVPMKPGPSA
ncbi:MAG: SPFH domain-containing protein [Sandaracinaceae bacterium]|nr:SPFH domain-containing protein [Sandaracinaceae bacterium]